MVSPDSMSGSAMAMSLIDRFLLLPWTLMARVACCLALAVRWTMLSLSRASGVAPVSLMPSSRARSMVCRCDPFPNLRRKSA